MGHVIIFRFLEVEFVLREEEDDLHEEGPDHVEQVRA